MIPTASVGVSWLSQSNAVTSGSPAIVRNLPVSYSLFYEGPTGLYATCIGAFSGTIRAGGSSSYVIGVLSFSSSRDIHNLTWSIATTNAPGVFDSIDYWLRRDLRYVLSGIEFHYKFDSGSFLTESRTGFVIYSASSTSSADPSAASASPHITIDPLNFDSDNKLPGDIYLVPDGLTIPRGLRLIDLNAFGLPYTGSFITSVRNETIFSATIRATSLDAPTHSIAGWNGVVADRGHITVTSGGIGPLVRNADWGGGLYMPDSTSVAIYGPQMMFLVPSGNVGVSSSFQLVSGTLNVLTGSIYLRGPIVSLSIEGVSASGLLNGLPWASLTQSRDSVVNTVGGTPALFDGVLLLVPSSSGVPITTTPNLKELHLRISGSWYPIVTQSTTFPLLDGGLY